MIDEYLSEARQLRESGDLQGAITACERAIEIDPADHRPHYLLGQIAILRTRHRNALEHFRDAARLAPDDLHSLNNLGMSLKDFGEFDEARAAFQRAIDINPRYAPGYYNLTSVSKFNPDDPVIQQLESLIGEKFENENDESLANFALGKVYDDIGEYDRAFGHFQKANALQNKFYDHQNTLKMFARGKAAFTRQLIEKHAGKGNQSRAPVFIVGMPRSGSSLLEEILCRNPDITGYSERAEAAKIVLRLERTHPSQAPYPEVVKQISPEQFDKLGELYLMLLNEVQPLTARAVDKNILNHSIAGFLRLMFPHAAIVHTARDAIDTCLSCYFQNFREGIEYSFDLEDLGKRYAAYADLMRHWEEVLGEGLFTMKYEELVADKTNQTMRLFDHIGMPAPANLEAAAPAERAIPTASAWQARQPVYASSVKRWKNYEKHLGPLFKALEDEGFNYAEH